MISIAELHMYHRIDREVFTRLVTTLMRDPAESLLVIAVWLWLEDKGFSSLISMMSKLSNQMVNVLAREAVSGLNCLESDRVPNVPPNDGMYFTSRLLDRTDLSRLFFYHNRFSIIVGVKKVLNNVCAKIFTDILPLIMGIQVRLNQPIPVAGFPHQLFGDVEIVRRAMNYVEIPAISGGDQILQLWGMPVIIQENDVSEDDRTMFLTFSRGFRVTENEVRVLFTRLYGLDAVADVIMQEIISDDTQPLFARLILNSITTADRMLNGRRIAKFRVNGKHIWARKYERRDI
ncbi:hypothetical protein Ddye_007242 [Dipteronia dyeriana]|uniref:Uncharacterized protein n=1 Tax=Dipteronia dyeriana TaxID=168575 RepID=A0AAD9XJQ8_9ROSI|nr:hypothetical protein Ddye_007242 [Dipteronia dyeriana]